MVTIAHLYPAELNIYGDSGNVIALRKRLEGAVPDTARPEDSAIGTIREQIGVIERKGTGLRERIVKLQRETIDQREVASALSIFEPVWEQLRDLAHLEKVSQQELFRQAFDMLFADRGLSSWSGAIESADKEREAGKG